MRNPQKAMTEMLAKAPWAEFYKIGVPMEWREELREIIMATPPRDAVEIWDLHTPAWAEFQRKGDVVGFRF
jgi:hypothetical protein